MVLGMGLSGTCRTKSGKSLIGSQQERRQSNGRRVSRTAISPMPCVPRRGSAARSGLMPLRTGRAALARAGRRRVPWILAALCLSAPCQGRTTARAFAVSPGPWSLERFGTDVAVLRNAPSTPSSGGAGLFFGCAGPERRFRLTFPAPVAPAGAGRGGTASIRPAGVGHPRLSVAARFDATTTTLNLISDVAGTKNPVSRLAELLAEEPRGLDVMVYWMPGPVDLARVDLFHLEMQGGAPQRSLVDQFLAACERPVPQQAD